MERCRCHTRDYSFGSQSDSGMQKHKLPWVSEFLISLLDTATLIYFSAVFGPRPRPKVKATPLPAPSARLLSSGGLPSSRSSFRFPRLSPKMVVVGLKQKDPRPGPLSPAHKFRSIPGNDQMPVCSKAQRDTRQSLTSSPGASAANGFRTTTRKNVRDPGTAMNSPHQGAALPAPPAT